MKSHFLIVFLSMFLDLYSKYKIKGILLKHDGVLTIFSNLNFVYVKNHGIIFGFMQEFGFALAIPLLVILIVIIRQAITKEENKTKKTLILLVAGGGLGNILDRLINGYVFDFIDLHAFGFHWYSFNVADIIITTGVLLLVLIDFYEYVFARRRSGIK